MKWFSLSLIFSRLNLRSLPGIQTTLKMHARSLYNLTFHKPFALLSDPLSHLLVCLRVGHHTAAPHLVQCFVNIIESFQAHQLTLQQLKTIPA